MLAMDVASSFALLTVMSLGYSTSVRRVERLRRAVTRDRTHNMLGVWTFAAIVVLPTPLLVAAIGLYYVAEWPSRRAVGRGRPLRYLYSAAASAAAAVVSSNLLHSLGPVVGIPVAVAAFSALNIGLIVVAMVTNRQFADLKMLKNLAAHRVEFFTYSLGVAVGEAMNWHPSLGVAAVPALVLAHLGTARRTVRETGAYDAYAQLWTEDAWMFQASEVANRGRWVSVILIDPQDSAEPQLPQIIRDCVEPSDPIGRYGNRGIAVLLPTSAACGGRLVGDSIARCLARQGVPCTLGIASARDQELPDMLIAALNDLIAARDREAARPGR